MSVDSITDLDDNQSRLLEALQLSLPADTPSKKEKHRDKRLSLNPIYRQVPRVVDSCCQHIEKYGEYLLHPVPNIYAIVLQQVLETARVFLFLSGLQTVGIFRVGSSKKRVRQVGVLNCLQTLKISHTVGVQLGWVSGNDSKAYFVDSKSDET